MIRLRYTGLLMFASSVLSLFTGLVFSSFVARSLSTADYGIWHFVSSTLVYFQFFQNLVPFWAFRDCSRGHPVEKTCVIGNLLLSLPFFLIYVAMVPVFADAIGSPYLVFYLPSLFIPIYFVEAGFNAVIKAKFPHKLAYKNIILDFLKLVSIVWLIQLGLYGVVFCIIAAYCIYLCFTFYITKGFMKDKRFDLMRLKRWLSSSWIVLYGAIGGSVYGSLDTLLLGILSSASILGSYGVALTIAGLLKLSGSLSSALYPKLLTEEAGKEDFIKETVMLTLMFLIPMAAGSILLAPNLIDIFGSKYLDCLPALYILVLSVFIGVINSIANQVIMGTEKTDLERMFSTRELFRSNIFFLFSLHYLATFISLPLMFLLIPKYGMIGCSVAILITTFLIFLINSYRAFKRLKILSYTRLCKFLFASSIMSAFIILVYARGTVNTLLIIFLGSAVYFVSLFTIDKETRSLVNKMLRELKHIVEKYQVD